MLNNSDRRICVVIPVYNAKKYLYEAVSSVLNQKYKKIEIILIDDGSCDGSSEICDNLAQRSERIFVIHQKNSGVSAARNAGIDYVLNKYDNNLKEIYVAFLDADDAWRPEWIDDHVIKQIKQNYDLIGFQSCRCNSKLSRRSNPADLKAGIYCGGNTSLWIHSTQSFGAMFYKCDLLARYDIRFKKLKYSEDKIFSMTCMYLADHIYLDNYLMYYYRQNSTSTMYNRSYGILYYTPIIEAYIIWEKEMVKWENERRGILHEGTTLARIYLKDMIDEHFQMGGSKGAIEEFLQNNFACQNILKNGRYRHNFRLCIYIIKNRVIGWKEKICRKITEIGCFHQVVDKMRYPIKLKNDIGRT